MHYITISNCGRLYAQYFSLYMSLYLLVLLRMWASIAFDFESLTAMGSNSEREFGYPTSVRNITGSTEDLATEIMHENVKSHYTCTLCRYLNPNKIA